MRLSPRYLIAPLLMALISVGTLADPASAQQAVTVQLTPQNNSGISGTATLTPMGQQTRVELKLNGAGAGPQPAHIHEGTCTNLNPAPKYPLTNVVNGSSETTLNIPLSTIQAAQLAVNVHKSPQEITVYVACGDIPMAAAAAGSPVSNPAGAAATAQRLPNTGQADFALYGPAALGGLLILGGAGLLLRRRWS